MIRMAIFLLVFLSVFVLMNVYTYRRFLSKVSFLQPYKRLIRYLFYFLLLTVVLFISSRGYDIYGQKVLWLFSYSIGILFVLFCAALVYDLTIVSSQKIPFDAGRRHFIKIAFDVTFLVMTASYLLKGIVNGLKQPKLSRLPVTISRLGQNGFRIVHLTDIHIGNVIKRNFVEEMVRRVNALSPDLIVITGDIIDADVAKISNDLAPLAQLKARHGTYGVLGNHEYFHDPHKAIATLEALGITVLKNESTVIADTLNLVGVYDRVGERFGLLEPDIPKAFASIDPALPTVALSHQPKLVPRMEPYRPDLVLCGHTHGGQIFPFGLLVKLDQPYISGLYRHDEHTQVFVSNGTGFWGPAIRVLADSEIVELTLKARQLLGV